MKNWLQPPDKKVMFLAAGSLTLAGVGAWLYASRYEVRNYKLDTRDVDISHGGAAGAAPLKILHISDLHLSKPESHKLDFLRRITDQEFDLVVLTGDVFENFSGVEYATRLLSRPPRLGAYAVLGNHDYLDYNMWHKILGRIYHPLRHPEERRDVTPMIEALQQGGFTVLNNSWCSHPDDKVFVLGVDYFGISEQKLKAIIDAAPEDHTIVALQHVPHHLKRFADHRVDMLFCGHTHGGQVRIPGFGAIITDSELKRSEASGLMWRDKTAIHVSRGVGADPRTNFRFFCAPHATILNLQRSSQLDQGRVVDIKTRTQKRTT